MYTGQVSGLFCGYPFALILLQTVHSDALKPMGILFHGNIDPSAIGVVVDKPSYFAVNPVNCKNDLFSAVVVRNILCFFCNGIHLSLQPISVRKRTWNVTF